MNSDYILPYHLLKFCFDCFVDTSTLNYRGDSNPFLSPIIVDDAILRKFPSVRIIVGSKDPLRDDSLRLLERMVSLRKDCKLFEFEHFPHGFLNYDYPLLMSGMEKIQKFVCDE
eukprot:CAMPEP_0170537616 /NCGR_PEP_ID=MMETSP0209-20121228/102821_1 /TAXON_ID=665100 ORGANISM="Litonotus pictus, Strain P1" /NCGR_SAMPLE_ID=MMETSP0209 /ASSEMBLY_ACC=CAM_ASM_000301 /LENGTH=113 /DNA_ID=CAMNT_0010839149 /DNA_START=1426 /DNA_END=1764 /DNA_ORIENTATION=+